MPPSGDSGREERLRLGADRSVSTVVLGEGNRVLLVLRGDIYLWSLPSGGVEPKEDWEDAAIREVLEETGYEVAVDAWVGEYWRPQIGDTKRLFRGRITGGAPRPHPPESITLRWFRADRLPPNRLPWLGEYVRDALESHPAPINRTQLQSRVQVLVMHVLYAVSDVRDRLFRRG